MSEYLKAIEAALEVPRYAEDSNNLNDLVGALHTLFEYLVNEGNKVGAEVEPVYLGRPLAVRQKVPVGSIIAKEVVEEMASINSGELEDIVLRRETQFQDDWDSMEINGNEVTLSLHCRADVVGTLFNEILTRSRAGEPVSPAAIAGEIMANATVALLGAAVAYDTVESEDDSHRAMVEIINTKYSLYAARIVGAMIHTVEMREIGELPEPQWDE